MNLRDHQLQKNNVVLIIIVVLAAMLLIAGFVFYARPQTPKPAPPETAIPTQIQTETKPYEEEVSFVVQDLLDDIISDSETLTGELSDVSGGSGNGEAYVLRKAGKLWHAVSATLPEPGPGTAYEGWLVNKTPTLKFFSTGVMEKQQNGAYMISFVSNNLYEGFNEVVITLETVVDPTPEDHILEGIVK